MFPGVVSESRAMIKLGPDVENGTTDAYSGYLPTGQVCGFSMMHDVCLQKSTRVLDAHTYGLPLAVGYRVTVPFPILISIVRTAFWSI